MAIKRIFIDMDGVLSDFVSAAMDVCGEEFDPSTYSRGVYGIHEEMGISEDEMWESIEIERSSFWEGLELYQWAKSLVDFCDKMSNGNHYILSNPSRDKHSWSGKKAWIDKNLPSMSGRIILAEDKTVCAMPGCVLIDDRDKNIDSFEKAGGRGILFPQVWNRNWRIADMSSETDTPRIEYARDEIERIARAVSHG